MRGTSRGDQILESGLLAVAVSASLAAATIAASPLYAQAHRGHTTRIGSAPDGLAASLTSVSEAALRPAEPSIPEAPVPVPMPPPAAVRPAPPVTPPVPDPRPASGSGQHSLINGVRDGSGLPPLVWSDCLAGVAAGEAVRMARDGALSHGGLGGDIACGLGGGAAENVGVWSAGVNDAQLHSMFVSSPGHLANILGPYRYVGAAWAVAADGKAYLAVEFA